MFGAALAGQSGAKPGKKVAGVNMNKLEKYVPTKHPTNIYVYSSHN
jgi:hypothetical protein